MEETNMSEQTKNYKFETLQQHAGQVPDPVTGSTRRPHLSDNFLCF